MFDRFRRNLPLGFIVVLVLALIGTLVGDPGPPPPREDDDEEFIVPGDFDWWW